MPFNIGKFDRPGCDETADIVLKKWVEKGLFKYEKNAYQLALAIATKYRLKPQKMVRWIKKYSPSDLDQLTVFCEVIVYKYILEYPDRCDQEGIAEFVSELATAGILFMNENNIIIDNQNINYEKLFSNE